MKRGAKRRLCFFRFLGNCSGKPGARYQGGYCDVHREWNMQRGVWERKYVKTVMPLT